jgi:hypothetical protein
MACGGCQNRQEALKRMQQAARDRDIARVAKMGAYVVKSGARDLGRVVSRASLFRTSRRGP